MRYSSFDLLSKRFAVSIFNDAKNRALVPITQRQCHDLGRNLPRLVGRHSAGFEQLCDPSPDNAHARLIEDARKVGEAPAFGNDQAVER